MMTMVDLGKVALTGLFICAWHARGEQGPAVGAPANVESRVNQILSQLTLEQKLSYIGGTGFFDIKPVPAVA